MREAAGKRKIVDAWCMYDWASSAFATTVMAALFPPFFRSLVTGAGLAESTATAYWGYTTAFGLLLIALLAPLLGAIADFTGGRKRYLGFFGGLGILATTAFLTIGAGAWRLAAGLYVCANIGFAGANIFYESLLPHITGTEDIDQTSTRGYALGYVGGGILLAVNLLWVVSPTTFGMPNTAFAVRASFLSVALWWGLFSVPLFRIVPEPSNSPTATLRVGGRYSQGTGSSTLDGKRVAGRPSVLPIKQGLLGLRNTLREVRRHRQLWIFLVAYWLYSDGIGTIVKMATAYGDEIGIRLTDMMIALVITQFVGIPCSLYFGRLARRIGAKRAILFGLAVYCIVCVGGFFMRSASHFYMLAILIGTVQGGTQGLSRSLFGAMVPKEKSAEFFGFFSTSGRFAGIAGPLLFGLVAQVAGGSRLAILALLIFFVAGGLLLTRVRTENS